MYRVKEIRIKNFKAFQDEQVFSFGKKGKNVLIYGNNGSGKSSLFWALYTLLQSSGKNNQDVQKYFAEYVASNTETHQTLKNVFVATAEGSKIQLTAINTETQFEKIFTISHDTINTNLNEDTLIQELNITSDFINYKLLHNFYSGSHKKQINVWPVFERDIFPFLTEGTKNWLEDIIKGQTLDVERTPKGNVVSQQRKIRNIQKLDALNSKITVLLSQIETNANSFIKAHFFDNKDVLKVRLEFQNRFKFENVRNNLWGENREGYRNEELHIKLSVSLYDLSADNNWRHIERVQSFLNEAQLTRIAIGIRIGALRTRPIRVSKFKILVLDDMLISLDMSNRMDMVRILLNTENNEELEAIFGGYQKFILTHDKGFYELLKRYTNPDDWEYLNFHSSEDVKEAPRVKKDRSGIEKAKAFLVDGEYDACGNELRKETEAILDKYLKGLRLASAGEFEPLMNKLNKALKDITENNRIAFNQVMSPKGLSNDIIEKLKIDFENDMTLSPLEKGKLRGLRNDYVRFLTKKSTFNVESERIIGETKDILRRIMNPASHASLVPIYEEELRKAIDGVVELKRILN